MYNHKEIEKKWQDFWDKNNVFKVENPSLTTPYLWEEQKIKPKYYCLDMFPYPSGAGLHVWHPEWYTANDIVARYKHANWYNVLHPMWWDAFWLPAENYAIKTWTHPRITTDQNIANFKKQIKALGFSYDWDREINTTDPKYYKWTQWIFLKMFEAGLAYEQDLPINYCPSCKTGLALEEVLNDFTCDRCGTKVEKRKLRQWVLAITKYADRLLNDVDKLDWPEWIKDMQRNWIWKSEWCEFEMKLYYHTELDLGSKKTENIDSEINSEWQLGIRVYTTRIDTVFGMSYAVLAPDHFEVLKFITPEQREVCQKYIEESKKKSDQDRTQDNKEKTWVFTWSYLVNPYNWEKVSLWIADYVLWSYGTWAVMAVPSHDERDFEFAKKYDLPIKQVIATYNRLTWESEPKDWFPTRIKNCTTSIIKHSSEDKYLIENFSNWEVCLLWWWIEDWEWIEESMLREIKEESWLYDIKSYKKVWIMVWHGFKSRKNTNCKDPDYFYLVLLNSQDGFIETLSEDNISYKNEWWTKDEILNSKVIKSHHKKMFEIFLEWEEAFCDDWILMDSGDFSMLTSVEAREKLTQYAVDNWFWIKKVNYKLRDWLFSRQRYWGEPIPLIHIDLENLKKLPHIDDLSKATDKNLAYILKREAIVWEKCDRVSCWCGHVRELVINQKVFSKIYDWLYSKIVCDYTLPLELPKVENYEPSWDWNSPLAKVENFVNIKLADNLVWRRETNTMPQWGWSCWYYLRFMDRENNDELVSNDAVNYWWEVDSYVGWAEHAVLHLLYSRFWHKFLFDIWVVPTDEPFYRLKNQWLILSYAFQRQNWWLVANDEVEEKDWKFYEIKTWEKLTQIVSKMSKSLKNVINPDDIIEEFGADSLRLYEMYMADFSTAAPWDSKNIIWVRRFIEKLERLFTLEAKISTESDDFTMKLLHKTIKKVWEDIENYKFNTAIAQMMILVNNWLPKDEKLSLDWKEKAVIIVHPFAPHLAEELWERLWNKTTIFNSTWPKYDENLVKDDIIVIWVQVLWKLRWEIEIWVNEEQSFVLEKAKNNDNVKKWLEWKHIIKEIYVRWKIVNIVTR